MYVARANKQQFIGFLPQQERVEKIAVLGYNNALLLKRKAVDFCIRGAVAGRKVERMEGFVPQSLEHVAEPPRKLCVDEEFHGVAVAMDFTRASRAA